MKRQDTFAKILIVSLVIIFAIITMAFAIMPINDAKMVRESFNISYTGTDNRWIISGKIDNSTMYDVKEMEYFINSNPLFFQ